MGAKPYHVGTVSTTARKGRGFRVGQWHPPCDSQGRAMKRQLMCPLIFAGLVGVACRGDDSRRGAQQSYETVEEGSAAGVTSTIHGPGEVLPPVTSTDADTTTAFTFDPNAIDTAPSPMTTTFTPPPAYPSPQTSASPTPQRPVPKPEPEPEPEPAPPTDTAPPTQTDTNAPPPEQEEPEEEEPPPPPPTMTDARGQ